MKRSISTHSVRGRRAVALALAGLCAMALSWMTAARPVSADSYVATVIAVDGSLFCDRASFGHRPVMPQFNDLVADVLTTNATSVAAVEFVIGGKLGINQGSSIRILGNRVAADAKSGQILQLESGTIWAKFKHQTGPSPLIIRTRNSTIGIRGTEFVVSQPDKDGDTTIDVFEGTVAYAPTTDAAPDLPPNAALAGPGSRIVIKAALAAPVVRQYDPAQLRKEDADRYKSLASALVALHIVTEIAGFVPGGSGVCTYAGYAAMGVEAVNDPETAARNLAASAAETYVPGGGILGGVIRGGGNKKKEPNFIVELKPDQATASAANLQFSWKPFKDSRQYVFLVSRDENMKQENLDYATQVRDTTFKWPSDGPSLQPGQKYYWRVVALGDDGKPRGKASQTWFTAAP